ncbi:helix-turn-helix domain-containing protein [Flagellimonas myxillae]|uniref:helix-turn-helix domain-containing protein n=1 Tax=Flagellimonas myxillae TaxID=2942214 RepID=UPI00201EFED4|nr:helix-turn-helix transcriptional regulator [Muricauda myxillae]MCL6264931.1 helix-turn-helix domain-containing protein [Muricauda myxillae]
MAFRDKEKRKESTEFLKEFGAKVKAYREMKGLSQFEFSIECGLSRTQISRIENGVGNITLVTTIFLIKALKLEDKKIIELLGLE